MSSFFKIISFFLTGIFLFPVQNISASERYTIDTILTTTDFRFNNENWFTEPHPTIATFTINEDGSAYGLTQNSIPFSQYNIPNALGIRVQRFEIQDHYHYIVDGEIAYTSEELSIQLAHALERKNATL